MMNTYLQACEACGSLYGKKQKGKTKPNPSKTSDGNSDLTGSYTKLYKSQVVVMRKVFRRGK